MMNWNGPKFHSQEDGLTVGRITFAPRIYAPAPTEIERLYYELLYAVAKKFPGESRHQTALRYIREREEGSNSCEAQQA